MNNIIKISSLKKTLDYYQKSIFTTKDELIQDLNKYSQHPDYSFTNVIEFQMFSFILLDLYNNLIKIRPLLDLEDIPVEALSVEHRLILENFTFFLLNFWTQGLKTLATLVNVGKNLQSYIRFNHDYFYLFSFWFYTTPKLLNELKLFFVIPKPVNLPVDVCFDLYKYLIGNDSFLYIFFVYTLHEGNYKSYISWQKYNFTVLSYIKHFWFNQFDSAFIFYLLSLLKESNKNFSFKVEKLYKDVDGEPHE